MAAYPLPNVDPPVYHVNAATGGPITVVQGQSILWENHTTADIPINVDPVNGVYPLNVNSFPVPKTHISVGSFLTVVLKATPPNTYQYTNGAEEGGGKIIVQKA